MDLLDRALAARIDARRKADELKQAAAAEQKKAAEERARVQKVLDTFMSMRPHEVCRLSSYSDSTSGELLMQIHVSWLIDHWSEAGRYRFSSQIGLQETCHEM